MSVFESLLNQTFTQSRIVRTSGGSGKWPESLTELGTVLGRLRPASSTEREVAAAEQRQISHVLYTLADVDIQRGDEMEGDGVIVAVQGVREPSRAGHHLEIDCLEVQREATEEEGS